MFLLSPKISREQATDQETPNSAPEKMISAEYSKINNFPKLDQLISRHEDNTETEMEDSCIVDEINEN